MLKRFFFLKMLKRLLIPFYLRFNGSTEH